MMFKKIIVFLFILLSYTFNPTYAETPKSLLIINDFKHEELEFNISQEIENSLSEYSVNIQSITIDEYSSEYLESFDAVCLINPSNSSTTLDILKDIKFSNTITFWIGGNEDVGLLEYVSEPFFNILHQSKQALTVNFYGNEYFIDNNYSTNIVTPLNNSNTIATISNGYSNSPYVIQNKKIFYFAGYNNTTIDILDYLIKNELSITSKENNSSSTNEDIGQEALEDNFFKKVNSVAIFSVTIFFIIFAIIFINFKFKYNNKFKK